MTIGKRIKDKRIELGLSQAQLADLCQWDNGRARVSNYENNLREPNSEDIKRIAKALNTSPSFLQFGEQTENYFNKSNLKHTILPLLGLSQIEDWLKHPELTLNHRKVNMYIEDKEVGKRLYLIEVNGDAMISMQNAADSIYPGEIALIDPDTKPLANDFVLIKSGQEKMIRQLIMDGTRHIFIALNPKYENITYTPNIEILGVVLETHKVRRKLKSA